MTLVSSVTAVALDRFLDFDSKMAICAHCCPLVCVDVCKYLILKHLINSTLFVLSRPLNLFQVTTEVP